MEYIFCLVSLSGGNLLFILIAIFLLYPVYSLELDSDYENTVLASIRAKYKTFL